VATSSAVLGQTINTGVALNSSGIASEITAGTFTINGVAFTVDPATDSLDSILADINASSAGVTATYDAGTDKITIANTTAGNTNLINFGATGDDSNFLSVVGVTSATQLTNGSGSTEVTSTRNLGAIDSSETLNNVTFAGGAATSGTFYVNGAAITIDTTTDTIGDVMRKINESDANVTASYDATNDTIQVVSKTLGSRTVAFTSGTSNFLDIANLTTATQVAGSDSQFSINGGPLQTRNTNEVADAIGGVTLSLLSTGTSTVTVSTDDDAIVEDIQEFIEAFNTAVDDIRGLTGESGLFSNDLSIRTIESSLRTEIFNIVNGLSGDFRSLLDIGISTGDSFDASAVAHLELDEDAFRDALRTDRTNVAALFNNSSGTGVADALYDYLDEVTKTTGFLNSRAKANGTIDQQIESYNTQIENLQRRLTQREERLRAQFTRLEQYTADLQSQSSSLSALGGGYAF